MVCFKPPSISKHKRVTSESLSRSKFQWFGRTPVIRASRQGITKKSQAALPRLLSTLRLSAFSKHSWPNDDLASFETHRRIIRVSTLTFESVNKPPIVIPGPSLSSFCMSSASTPPIGSISHDTFGADLAMQGYNSRTLNSIAMDARLRAASDEGIKDPGRTVSSSDSFTSWVEVSEPGSPSAVRIPADPLSTSSSLLHDSEALPTNTSEGSIPFFFRIPNQQNCTITLFEEEFPLDG
jgi:hypothetical protein